jgi:hypothetical protein
MSLNKQSSLDNFFDLGKHKNIERKKPTTPRGQSSVQGKQNPSKLFSKVSSQPSASKKTVVPLVIEGAPQQAPRKLNEEEVNERFGGI